jgi:hypothetical protein
MLNTNGIALERNCAAETDTGSVRSPNPSIHQSVTTRRPIDQSGGGGRARGELTEVVLEDAHHGGSGRCRRGRRRGGSHPCSSEKRRIIHRPRLRRRLQSGVPRARPPGASRGRRSRARAQRRQESRGRQAGGEAAGGSGCRKARGSGRSGACQFVIGSRPSEMRSDPFNANSLGPLWGRFSVSPRSTVAHSTPCCDVIASAYKEQGKTDVF